MLKQMEERGERATEIKGRPKKGSHVVTLSDLYVSPMQSSRWQEIAEVPKPIFEEYIEREKERETGELTAVKSRIALARELRKLPAKSEVLAIDSA